MIIKITRSTSRISINGTTFISETTPRLPPTIIPMSHLVLRNRKAVNVPEQMPREEDSHITWRHAGPRQRERAKNLLTGFEFCGNQADFVDARAAHDVDSARDFHEHYIVVAFDKAIFSARSLKICSMRGPRPSQVVSSLLILSLPFFSTWTTTVLFSSSTFCCWFGEG